MLEERVWRIKGKFNIWLFCVCLLVKVVYMVSARVMPRIGVTVVITCGVGGICGTVGNGNNNHANTLPIRMEPIVRLNSGR